MFFITDRTSGEATKCHEHGHGIQNCIYGFFMPFLVRIPSAVRFWSRELIARVDRKKRYALPDYDSVWFESQATRFGTALHKTINMDRTAETNGLV